MRCSVILLASGGPAPVLASLHSALAQDLDDHEVILVGNGLEPAARTAVAERAAADDRVQLRDLPRGAGSGEAHLVGALAVARGEIIAYLVAGDLWSPDHLRVLDEALDRPIDDGSPGGRSPGGRPLDRRATLAHTLAVHVGPGLRWVDGVDLGRPEDRAAVLAGRRAPSLSSLAHTAVAYAALDLGWRVVPGSPPGDDLVRQLLADPRGSALGATRPTALVWDAGVAAGTGSGAAGLGAPGLGGGAPDEVELARWEACLADPVWRAEELPALAIEATVASWRATEVRLQAIVGSPPWVAVDRVVTKARRVVRRLRGRSRP